MPVWDGFDFEVSGKVQLEMQMDWQMAFANIDTCIVSSTA